MNFTMARMEFPCAATSTVLPALSSGAIVSSQYGITRAIVSFKHSVSGRSLGSNFAYLASLQGWYWIFIEGWRRNVETATPNQDLLITILFHCLLLVKACEPSIHALVQ